VLIPATAQVYMFVPLTGPAGVDLTQYAGDLALVADNGTEPGPADWHAAAWLAPETGAAKELALLVGGTGQVYPPGDYMAWWRLTAGAEKPVDRSGRVRIGTP
jgi:hypothetical protein